jgi:N-acetylglutamate synthase-like GNAT family acetyltransferase
MMRPARKDDFPAIRSLIHAVHINPTGLDWRHFLVAETLTGAFLGCGQIKPHSDGSRELASIAVLGQARGQGVARKMIETLLLRESRRPLYLMCRSRLKLLYTKFGFRPIGPDLMPPYFQRISRIERIFNSSGQQQDRLLVMRLD